MRNKPQQLPLLTSNGTMDIKSPIFQAKPGWGGKLKKWLSRHFPTKILPVLAFGALALGIYLILQ